MAETSPEPEPAAAESLLAEADAHSAANQPDAALAKLLEADPECAHALFCSEAVWAQPHS